MRAMAAASPGSAGRAYNRACLESSTTITSRRQAPPPEAAWREPVSARLRLRAGSGRLDLAAGGEIDGQRLHACGDQAAVRRRQVALDTRIRRNVLTRCLVKYDQARRGRPVDAVSSQESAADGRQHV